MVVLSIKWSREKRRFAHRGGRCSSQAPESVVRNKCRRFVCAIIIIIIIVIIIIIIIIIILIITIPALEYETGLYFRFYPNHSWGYVDVGSSPNSRGSNTLAYQMLPPNLPNNNIYCFDKVYTRKCKHCYFKSVGKFYYILKYIYAHTYF